MFKNLHHMGLLPHSRPPRLPPRTTGNTHRNRTLKPCQLLSEMRVFSYFLLNKDSQLLQLSLFLFEQGHLFLKDLSQFFNFSLLLL